MKVKVNDLVRLHKVKQEKLTRTKPAPKKGRANTTQKLHLVTNVYEDDNFSRQVPEKNTVLV